MPAPAPSKPKPLKPILHFAVPVIFMPGATLPESARAQDTKVGIGISGACAVDGCAAAGRDEKKGI